MVIAKGRYRGWDIGIGLLGGTDGQVEEDLDKMDFGDLAPMPTMESNDQPIDESRIVREEWTDEKACRLKRGKRIWATTTIP